MSETKKYNLGLVLSGGGIKGLVHVGVLKYLEENAIRPDIISGTSVGALVGALYAAGHSADEIFDFFVNSHFFKTNHLNFRKPGLIDTLKLKKLFNGYIEKDDFSALKTPLIITATEMTNAKLRVFIKGELLKPLLASCAFPLVFAPVEIDGELYSDGGIMNHFPADLIRKKCDHLLGVFLSPVEMVEKKDLSSIRAMIERTFKLGRLATSVDNLKLVDVLINPKELIDYNTFIVNNSNYKKLYDLGYEYAGKHAKEIQALVQNAD